MAKLTAAERKALPSSKFSVPGKRALPIEDKVHAEKAVQLAPRAVQSGKITPAERKTAVAKAETVLHRGKRLPGYL